MDHCISLLDFIEFTDHEKDVALIVDNGREKHSLTYKHLKELSDKISDMLSQYTNKPFVVGICMETQLLTPAFLIGILKIGSAFYNFDADGLQFVQQVILRVGCNVIVTDGMHLKLLQDLISEFKGVVKPVKLMEERFYLISLEDVLRQYQSRQLAYVITTSGTTGVPKIVEVPHSCITPNIVHIRQIYNLSSDDIVFLCSPLTFDPSIVEVFTTLSVGAKLLIVPRVVKMMPDYLLDVVCQRNKVTVMQATPTFLSRFGTLKLKNSLLGDNSSLRVLSLGGEKFLDVSVLKSYRSNNNKTTFINLYGVTEVSAWATYYVLTDDDLRLETSIPLGTCLQETVMEVKDKSGDRIIEGIGELSIGGYKRQCVILTSNKDDDTYDANRLKLHSTGDMVRLDNKGNLFYVGRKDCQLKRHGKRINLEEITQVSLKHEGITNCTTLVMETKIVTFVTLTDRQGSDSIQNEIKTHIAQHLPSHSVPDDVVIIEYLPVTKHGKVDQCKLQEMYEVLMATNKPITYSTELLKRQWKAKLNTDEITIQEDSNFIQLGGNSLTAVHLLNDLEKYLGAQLSYLLDKLLSQTFNDCDEYIYNIYNGKKSTIQHQRTMKKRKLSVNSVHNQLGIESETFHSSRSFRYAISRGNQCQKCKLISGEGNSLQMSINRDLHTEQKKFKSRTSTLSISDESGDFKVTNNEETEFENETARYKNVDKVDCDIKETPLSQTKERIQLKEEWRFNTGKCVDASPLIAVTRTREDIILIGSHSHKFYAIDVTSGDSIWEVTLEDRIETSACLSLCGKFVIVGCYDSFIYSIESSTGSVWWKYQTGSQVKCCPVVDRYTGLVYAGSHSQSVYCFDIRRREVVWRKNLESGSIFASPAIDYKNGTVFVATLGGKVFSLRKVDGILMWTFDCKKPVFSSLTCTQNGVLVGCTDMCLYHIDFDGNLIWKFSTTGPIFSSPSIFQSNANDLVTETDPYIFFGSHDCVLYCLSVQGSLIWKTRVAAQVYSTPFCCDLIVHRENMEFVIEPDMPDDSNNIIKNKEQPFVDTDYISHGCGLTTEKSTCLTSNNSEIHRVADRSIEVKKPLKTNFSPYKGNNFSTNMENKRDLSNNIGNKQEFFNTYTLITPTDTLSEYSTPGPSDGPNSVEIISLSNPVKDLMMENKSLPNTSVSVVVFCTTDGTLYILNVKDGSVLCEKLLTGEVFSSPLCYEDSIFVGCRDDYVYKFRLNQH